MATALNVRILTVVCWKVLLFCKRFCNFIVLTQKEANLCWHIDSETPIGMQRKHFVTGDSFFIQ